MLPLFAFLALFPGTFLYQTSVAIGIIPAFAGGYFGLASAALLAPLLLVYSLRILKKMRLPFTDAAYLGFLFYFATVAILHSLLDDNDQYLGWHLGSIAQCLCVFLIFRSMANLPAHAKIYLWLAVGAMTACIFYFTEEGSFSLKSHAVDAQNVSSYQGFALYFLMTAVCALRYTQSRFWRFASYPVLCLALYLNGARSEFAGFIIFFFVFEVCRSRRRLLCATTLASVAIVIAATAHTWQSFIPASRVANLGEIGQDTSYQLRMQIEESGISKIMDSPITGAYGDYEKGLYIHNALSAWQDLGLFGFLYMCCLALIPFASSLLSWMTRKATDADHAFIIASLVAVIMLLIYAKYFTYFWLPAVIGYYSSTWPIRPQMRSMPR